MIEKIDFSKHNTVNRFQKIVEGKINEIVDQANINTKAIEGIQERGVVQLKLNDDLLSALAKTTELFDRIGKIIGKG